MKNWLFLLAVLGSLNLPTGPVFSEQDRGPGGYCPVGQVWPGYDPDWSQPGTITGAGQTFFTLIDPGIHCDCPAGFALSTIDFFMTIPDESPFPITISVSLGLKEAISNPEGDIPWLPGGTVCESPVRPFGVPFPKDFLGFGVGLDCDCYEMGGPAFLFFTIHSTLDPPGGLYTTGGGAPELGRYLTRVDSQWLDLVGEGTLTTGDLVVSGFASCCEPPVGNTAQSWGSIKAWYQ